MTEGTHSYDDKSPHGNVGEEAAKLAEAVQDWLGERTGRVPRDVWAMATGASEDFHSPECRVCPLCRAMRFFTSISPQVLDHLTDAAASLSSAMRAMSEERERAGSAARGTNAPPDRARSAPRDAPTDGET
jgi:hypothetical protein